MHVNGLREREQVSAPDYFAVRLALESCSDRVEEGKRSDQGRFVAVWVRITILSREGYGQSCTSFFH